jgi:predicted dehydrogenase
MKQVIRKGLKHIIVDEVPDPVVTPHHVIVRPVYSLISSGTETASIHSEALVKEVAENPSHLNKIWQAMKATDPMRTVAEVRAKFSEYAVLGYSGAGVIVDKHATVTNIEIGERVAYGGEGTGHGEYILTGRNLAARIPDAVDFKEASFATLGSIALNAVRISGITIGDVVAVIGLGLVGQLIAQLVRCHGGIAIAIDLKTDRLELAKNLGSEHTLMGGGSLRDSVNALTAGRGADCVIVAAAAKSAAPCQQALDICRDRGRIVVVGAVEMSFPWNDMYMKEIQLFMARAYGPGSYDPSYERKGQDYPISYVRWTENRNMEEFLRLVGTGQVRVQPLITHEFALDDAAQGYQTILNPASGSLAVVIRYPALETPVPQFAPKRKVEIAPSQPKGEGEIRFGLIGAGNLARWAHLPNLKKIPNVSLQGVFSAQGARGKSYALRFGAKYCCSDYQEILNDASVDAVMILTRNQHHAPQTIAALRAGKHVFVEKPMALTEEECSEIYQAVQESGKTLTVGFNRRFAPYYVEVKKHLARRSAPAVLNCRINSPGIAGSYWMADPSTGGAILGEACHFVDLFYWLLDSEPVEVSAYSLPTGKTDPIGENNIVASFRFEDGSIANLTYCTVGSKTSAGERLEVFAPGIGAVTEDFKEIAIKGGSVKSDSKMFAEKGYAAQLQDFVSAIRKGVAPQVTVLDGVRSTIGCLRMLESARNLTASSLEWKSFAAGK